MQEEDIEHDRDATTRASTSRNRNMNDKRDDARRMAEELIAEEKQRRSAITTYLIATITGLVFWAVVYFIWRAL
jgi:hypothetical protein